MKPIEWEDGIVLFVGYLINKGRKASTVNSYISAIKAVLWENNISVSEDRSLLKLLTKACQYRNDRVMLKFPIGKNLLNRLLAQVEKHFLDISQPYLAILYQAMFASPYYGLLRVGEVATGDHPILARDVHIGTNKDKILFVLCTSKTHWLDDIPQSMKISSI